MSSSNSGSAPRGPARSAVAGSRVCGASVAAGRADGERVRACRLFRRPLRPPRSGRHSPRCVSGRGAGRRAARHDLVRPRLRAPHVLGEVVRRVAGEPLDAFVTREVFVPLGLHQTMFRPPSRLRARIAPTGLWRGHPVAGTVNDGSAFKLRGVSGNAGLFSTASDVARFAQFMLRGGTSRDGRRLLGEETLRLFTSKATTFAAGTEARALGWQAVPTGESVSSAGTLFGPRSYGHTGWTGTSLWIDPDRDLFVVLLTNRAYAPRARRPFTLLKQVRSGVADAAARASDAR